LLDFQILLPPAERPVAEERIIVKLQLLPDRMVEILQAKKSVFGQGIVDALVDQGNRAFNKSLVLWMVRSGGIDHAIVMPCKILKGLVDHRGVFMGFGHHGTQVVGNDGKRYTTEISKAITHTGDGVFTVLRWDRFYK